MAQNKSQRVTIGPGRAVYPALRTPDTKFDELGQYKADLAIPLSEAEPLMKKLSDIHKAHTGKAPSKSSNTMWYLEEDKETGEETGNVIFKCRVKNRMRRDGQLWDRRPKLFSADLKPVEVNPWGGTVMAVSAEVYEWDAGGKKGVSLQPVGVQIIELVEGGGESAEDMGFGKRDGFTAGDVDDDLGGDFIPDGTEDEDGDY